MNALARFGAPAIAACAVVALTPAPASAATTTVRRDNSAGLPYSGDWRLAGLDSFAFTGRGLTVKCAAAQLTGKVTAKGEASIERAAVSGCESATGRASVGFADLPYKVRITHNPFFPGPNATVAAAAPRLRISVPVIGGSSCDYGQPASAFGGLYNRDSFNRPLPVDETQLSLTGVTLALLPGSGPHCPATGELSGVFQVRGTSQIGIPGDFAEKLYVTS